jgi:hypothetical protein
MGRFEKSRTVAQILQMSQPLFGYTASITCYEFHNKNNINNTVRSVESNTADFTDCGINPAHHVNDILSYLVHDKKEDAEIIINDCNSAYLYKLEAIEFFVEPVLTSHIAPNLRCRYIPDVRIWLFGHKNKDSIIKENPWLEDKLEFSTWIIGDRKNQKK